MRPSGDVYSASPRRYKTEELNDPASPMRNDSNRRSGSHRSSRNNEDYDSESSSSSSSKKTTRSNQDHQQAEVLRKLESLKGHLLRTNPKDSDQPPPMGFHGGGHHVPPYYNNPYPEPYPYGMYPPQSHVPPPYGFTRPPQGWYHGAHHPPYPQGQYVDIGSDIIDPHDHRFFPTPSRYGDVPFSPVRNQGDKLGPFSPHSVVQGHHHTRWPSEIESDIVGGYVQKDVSDNDSRRCHPLVGGAPFIACHNCFELLYLPKKKLLVQEKQQKLECGACSEVISFAFVDKKLVFSLAETHTNPLPVEAQVRTTVVDDCPLKDQEPRMDRALSPSEHSDDEDRSSVSSESQKQVIKSVRRKVKATKVPPPPPEKSNLLELFEYSNVNRAALTYGMEQLGYNKQRQDSVKPESEVATETEVSYNEYYNNTEVSEDSRISKASEYSISEVTDKAISNDENMEQLEVWVNGHLIPEDLVISAEKLAGPVQAGKYWYDYRAGFWGVMGSPCLGIIPPFIEEFSRPMPDNCGAGNTGVFVNGRELHERDFELLARRGLPRGKNRSYIIDISGRVLDGDSGEELNCLGKLAPTIEKVKHGFGMRVPRSLLVSS